MVDGCRAGTRILARWQDVGTWEVDKARFPNGLRAVSDYAHG